jgi:3-deoxy-D-manno-octulosonic-acid transferase
MLYSIGFFIFSIFYLPALIFKGKLHGSFAERFSIFDADKKDRLLRGSGRIWIQAVSVGEVALCKSLVPALKEKYPGRDIVISTITKTGNDLAKKLFSKEAIVIYFPLDFLFIARKAVSLIKPSLYIMIETEIWPNVIRALGASAVPCVMINGRISDRSIGKYRLAKPFLKGTLNSITVFCMQDDIDARRIIELGATADRVTVTGNMKFDMAMPAGLKDLTELMRSFGLKEGDKLIVGGSTHEGEESALLEAFGKLRAQFPGLKLLIAPRHVERAASIRKMIEERALAADGSVILLDKIGHLNEAYSLATIVFVGGSLIEHGGQNPIEPAYLAKPILFGRHMFNFKYVTKALLGEKAVMQVFSVEDLYEKLKVLLEDANLRKELGERAKKVIENNTGATAKNITRIGEVLA